MGEGTGSQGGRGAHASGQQLPLDGKGPRASGGLSPATGMRPRGLYFPCLLTWGIQPFLRKRSQPEGQHPNVVSTEPPSHPWTDQTLHRESLTGDDAHRGE